MSKKQDVRITPTTREVIPASSRRKIFSTSINDKARIYSLNETGVVTDCEEWLAYEPDDNRRTRYEVTMKNNKKYWCTNEEISFLLNLNVDKNTNMGRLD